MNSRGPRAAPGGGGARRRASRSSITQQRHTLHLSCISFLPGQEAHLPKVNKKRKEGFLLFFFPQEINVPDKWGFCPLGLWSTNKHQSALKKRSECVPGIQATWNLTGDGGSPVNVFATFKNHIMKKIKLDIMFLHWNGFCCWKLEISIQSFYSRYPREFPKWPSNTYSSEAK